MIKSYLQRSPFQPIAAVGTTSGVLWEAYRYPPGPAGESPRHVHETHQICLSLNFPGEYRYRGATLAVPRESVSIIHPGEPHSSRDRQARPITSAFRLLYIPIKLWVADRARTAPSEPFFADAVLTHPLLFARLLRLHEVLQYSVNPLQTETVLRETLPLLQSFSQSPPSFAPVRPEPEAVRRVRHYLADHAQEKVRLPELSQVAGLSEYHLLRVFRQQVGLPPHAYQLQLRLDRARRLLVTGCRIGEIAAVLGFADQSHFTRTFRRVVGCTPQQYVSAR